MRKHDHGQIPMSNYSKIKLKTRSLFKNGCSIKLNGQDGKGDLQSRQDSNSLDLEDGSNLNDDEDKQGRLARSVEDDDEIEDYDDDDDDEDDEEDEDLDDEDDEDYDEDESEEFAKSVENKKVLVQSN